VISGQPPGKNNSKAVGRETFSIRRDTDLLITMSNTPWGLNRRLTRDHLNGPPARTSSAKL